MSDEQTPKDESKPPAPGKPTNYPPNSNKSKAAAAQPKADAPKEKPKVEKVISGEAVIRKRGFGRKLKEVFTVDDMQSVGNYILYDVIVPTTRNLIVDILTQSVERTFNGGGRPNTTRYNPQAGRSQTNYSGMYNKTSSPTGRAGEQDGPRISQHTRSVHEFEDIVLQSRGEAETVLDKLRWLIEQYDVATVSDLYDSLGVTAKFTDDRWGWTNLVDAGIERVRGGGYILLLPKTVPIN